MKRIDLAYGAGDFSVVLDVAAPRLLEYSGVSDAAEWLHKEFGGEQYYRSISGLSGAGWIPAAPHLRLVGTYRTDAGHPRFPRVALPAVGRWAILAPIGYRGGGIPAEWPVLIVDPGEGGEPAVLHVRETYDPLPHPEEEEATVDETFTVGAWVTQACDPLGPDGPSPIEGLEWREVTCVVRLTARRDARPDKWRQAVRGWLRDTQGLRWDPPTGVTDDGACRNPFWSRLGLQPLVDGRVAVIRERMCSRILTVEEASSRYLLQDVAPRGITMITHRCYVREEADRTVGVLLGEDGVEVEHPVATPMFIEALRAVREEEGEGTALLGLLQEALAEKQEARAEYERRRQEEALPGEQHIAALQEWIRSHGEFTVTIADSLVAGNCRAGTQEWLARHFAGREAVTVAELAAHASDDRVRRVLDSVWLRS